MACASAPCVIHPLESICTVYSSLQQLKDVLKCGEGEFRHPLAPLAPIGLVRAEVTEELGPRLCAWGPWIRRISRLHEHLLVELGPSQQPPGIDMFAADVATQSAKHICWRASFDNLVWSMNMLVPIDEQANPVHFLHKDLNGLRSLWLLQLAAGSIGISISTEPELRRRDASMCTGVKVFNIAYVYEEEGL